MGTLRFAHQKAEMGTGICPLPILLNYILFNSCSNDLLNFLLTFG